MRPEDACNYLTLKTEGINVFGEKSIKNAREIENFCF
jgi:hypothetical protein